jgi:1,4-alpha-glucan branching enzyme
MGAICDAEGTTFRLFAPTAERVDLLLYDLPEGGTEAPHALTKEDPYT